MASLSSGFLDIKNSLSNRDMWLYMGWQDIKQRYRRSVLGPWWITLSTGLIILTLGLVWSQVFKQAAAEYMQFFSVGIVIWTLVSGFLNESAIGITQFEGLIKQRKTTFFIFVLRVYVRHLIIFLHNLVIILLVFFYFKVNVTFNFLLFLPYFILFSVTLVCWGMPIALFCARFRDMPQIVTNLIQVLFYLTPIIWRPEQIGNYENFLIFNPIYPLVSVLRKPLLSEIPNLSEFSIVCLIGFLGFFISVYLLERFSKRISYWL